MRRFYSPNRPRSRVLILALTVVLCLVFGACSFKKGPVKRIPTAKKPPQKDVIRPADTQPVERPVTPQNVASQKLIRDGMALLDEKNYELAAVRFQDAINVDPRSGEAYYYLALTDFYLGQYDESVGLLDKAKALLSYDERWLERIENLRASILVDEGPETQAQPL
jgi:tetratricopeptide (TPR) repeat protein